MATAEAMMALILVDLDSMYGVFQRLAESKARGPKARARDPCRRERSVAKGPSTWADAHP